MLNRRPIQVIMTIIAIVILLILPTFAIGRSVIEQYLQTDMSVKDGNF